MAKAAENHAALSPRPALEMREGDWICSQCSAERTRMLLPMLCTLSPLWFVDASASLAHIRWPRIRWGVGSVVVESAFLGRPDFQSRGPQTLILKGFGAIWGKHRGRPKNADPTTTDPTPHSRPSEHSFGYC